MTILELFIVCNLLTSTKTVATAKKLYKLVLEMADEYAAKLSAEHFVNFFVT